jgi:hypothetical protein
MLKFVDPPDDSRPDLVHCTLEYVSLDDFTPEFTQFLSQDNDRECNPQILRSWMGSGNSLHKSSAMNHLLLPLWRHSLQYGRIEDVLGNWNSLMSAIEIDPE